MKTIAKKIYLALICIILYAPIVTLIVLSFNNTKTRSKWGGFTGKWYVSLFQNKEIMNALYTTLIIALLLTTRDSCSEARTPCRRRCGLPAPGFWEA